VTIAEYVYNGLSQRIKKTLPGETRIFHYDPQGHLIAETNQAGQMLSEYFYLGDQLLAMIKPGEAVYYYHNDHLGTPQILTDENQTIVWKALYTPFGITEVLIETVENPFRFPGQYYDQETGLHYNYFRDYKPDIGRYLTPDPIGLEGGINLFVYVGNNPVNYTDPMGLEKSDSNNKCSEPCWRNKCYQECINICFPICYTTCVIITKCVFLCGPTCMAACHNSCRQWCKCN